VRQDTITNFAIINDLTGQPSSWTPHVPVGSKYSDGIADLCKIKLPLPSMRFVGLLELLDYYFYLVRGPSPLHNHLGEWSMTIIKLHPDDGGSKDL
jgi:hypothetical protein